MRNNVQKPLSLRLNRDFDLAILITNYCAAIAATFKFAKAKRRSSLVVQVGAENYNYGLVVDMEAVTVVEEAEPMEVEVLVA